LGAVACAIAQTGRGQKSGVVQAQAIQMEYM
jgi:hypothetical protein